MNKSVYFPSLNGIRCVAVLMVFIDHIEAQKHKLSYYFSEWGPLGVTLFFVLSGFLITYLLLEELKAHLAIDIKLFYIRRILRIWPVYFFTLACSLIYSYFLQELNFDFFYLKLFMFVTFLSNISFLLFSPGGFPGQLWSVASEEQFYIVWPWVVRNTKGKILPYALGVVFLFIFFRITLPNLHLPKIRGTNSTINEFVLSYITYFRIDCMAIGALGAYWLFNKNGILKIIYSIAVQIITLIFIIIALCFEIKIPFVGHAFYAILFMILIVNVASNKRTIVNLEFSVFNYIGKISYGIYAYHLLIISIIKKLMGKFNIGDGGYLFSLIVFGCTLSIASLSYYYFEKPILRIKNRYSLILSGDNV